MRDTTTAPGGSAVPLLEETDRLRHRLAQRFREAPSVRERFAISRELGKLLEERRELLRTQESAATA
jgi:hypothetical protein